MSNQIRFSTTAESDDWLVISNQGTDCFLELLISTADAIDKTKDQKDLIDFLKAQKMVNNIAPGTADFDIIDMPWKGECLMGICVSTGAACDSQNTQISHVLAAMNLERDYAEGTIRISFGKDNTISDAKKIGDAIIKILENG